MDYRNAFAISASGMSVEKLRLDVTAANLANIHSGKRVDGTLFQPMQVISTEAGENFSTQFEQLAGAQLHGAQVVGVTTTPTAPHMVYQPGNPDADDKGFVTEPGVNQVTEMVNMASALRAYEANVVAMNAAKTMALKALELGGS
ncbi:flagellar basal body rod protein FlgC [Solimicrobium silvestre]|uniref:Flagellar basal-body rod protein FlgC n=1 Tax=Solimicrobium silvestre TaxID=2099400 RepID=A0A2S9H1R7_9BURK|nr:flagellar basal body rod protein FlgC [Solimicrobium silvestre]PRC93908.1 FlgC: flagellar basal-body rod protein FlgC [Solimicrobium silvestre]